MTDLTWTDERIEQLRRLRAEGATFGEIARDIGCSRNAAIGKAGRLGLKSPDVREPRPPRRERKPRLPIAVLKVAARAERIEFGQFEAPPVRVEDHAIPVDQRKQLLDLGNEHCRWPCGHPGEPGFFFCGAPEADCGGGKPYCRAHAAIAFNGRPMRRPYVPGKVAA